MSEEARAPRFERGWVGISSRPDAGYVVRHERWIEVFDSIPRTGTYEWASSVATALNGERHPTAGADEMRHRRHDLPGVGGVTSEVGFLRARPGIQAAIAQASPTGCWFHWSEPFTSPFGRGDTMIRFYRDQQDACLWYLNISQDAAPIVLASWDDHAPDADESIDTPDLTRVWHVADSVEGFVNRVVGEAAALRSMSTGWDVPLPPQVLEYRAFLAQEHP